MMACMFLYEILELEEKANYGVGEVIYPLKGTTDRRWNIVIFGVC